MFDFYSMAGNYEDRLVENTKIDKVVIDTAAVTDSEQPYETGISHPEYNGSDWVIVEIYDTKALAEIGHKKWVGKVSKNELPDELEDVSTASITQLGNMFGGKKIYKRVPLPKEK